LYSIYFWGFIVNINVAFNHFKEKHMITNIIVFLVGAHLGAKYPQKATLVVDTAVGLAKSAWAKVSALVSKK
jgi:hypothetical protein